MRHVDFRAFVLALGMGWTTGASATEDIQLVKFLCSTPGAVRDVISRSDDLVVGVSRLPSGCRWLPQYTYGRVGATLFYVDTPGRRVSRVSAVTVGKRAGFSAGLVELLS